MKKNIEKIEIKFCKNDNKLYRYSLIFSTKSDFTFNNECVVILKNPSTTLLNEVEPEKTTQTTQTTQTKVINYSDQFKSFDITTQHVIKLFETDTTLSDCDGLSILNLITLYETNPNNVQESVDANIYTENQKIIKERLSKAKKVLLAWGSFESFNKKVANIFNKSKKDIVKIINDCPNIGLYEVRPRVCSIETENIGEAKPWHPQVWYFNELNDEKESIKQACELIDNN